MKKIVIGLIAVAVAAGLIGLFLNTSKKPTTKKVKPAEKKVEISPLIKLSKKITVGMADKEVRRIMGKPTSEQVTQNKKGGKTNVITYTSGNDTVTIKTIKDKVTEPPKIIDNSTHKTKTDSSSQNLTLKSNLADAFKEIKKGMPESDVYKIAGKAGFTGKVDLNSKDKTHSLFVKNKIILSVFFQKGKVIAATLNNKNTGEILNK